MINKYFKIIFVVATATCFTLFASAQDRVIHGIVTTFDSIPLIDAQVKVKSTKHTVLTDSLGRFSVPANPNEKLKISARGFFNQNVKLDEKIKFAAINLKIKPGEKNREYAIGYGHVTDKNKLNAVAMLDNRDVDFSNYNNMFELIKGRFANVQVLNGEIIIRGQSSISSTNAALILIDGTIVDESALNSIPPAHVKSINIIKDGSAAIYGSRGANGVVLIETKSGND